MSIINDALKKAQANLAKREKPAESIQKVTKEPESAVVSPTVQKAKQTSHKRKKVWYKTVAALVCFFFIITGILLAALLFLMNRSSDPENQNAKVRNNYRPKSVAKRTFKPGQLVLSGTTLVEGKYIALISGDIYELGEVVQDHKIMNIDMEKVELIDPNGDTVTLSVR